jgi:hypothetical protein
MVFSLATALSGGAQAEQTGRCSLGTKYPVNSVASYVTVENTGYTTYRQARGAELIVPAQPGLTREWLQRVLSFEIAEGTCDFGVPNVSVSVLPAGGAFSVRLSGNDQTAADMILHHAQQLVK